MIVGGRLSTGRSGVHRSPVTAPLPVSLAEGAGMHLAFYRTVVRQVGVLVDADLPGSPAVLVRAASLLLGGDLVACRTTAALRRRPGRRGLVHPTGPDGLRGRADDALPPAGAAARVPPPGLPDGVAGTVAVHRGRAAGPCAPGSGRHQVPRPRVGGGTGRRRARRPRRPHDPRAAARGPAAAQRDHRAPLGPAAPHRPRRPPRPGRSASRSRPPSGTSARPRSPAGSPPTSLVITDPGTPGRGMSRTQVRDHREGEARLDPGWDG
ncbi:hypothetical protein SAMN05660199_01456 [Klenkia soli]|uniref:Uncharacterized protein n=1 Tax=Klenkia soli TaxID=1052260 RepID=A0A1H0HGG2_9ACTN|nr:hypothetical protein SAMN05660199_01456 [Klenkia soli]